MLGARIPILRRGGARARGSAYCCVVLVFCLSSNRQQANTKSTAAAARRRRLLSIGIVVSSSSTIVGAVVYCEFTLPKWICSSEQIMRTHFDWMKKENVGILCVEILNLTWDFEFYKFSLGMCAVGGCRLPWRSIVTSACIVFWAPRCCCWWPLLSWILLLLLFIFNSSASLIRTQARWNLSRTINDGPSSLSVTPKTADTFEISQFLLVFRFHLRPIKWSSRRLRVTITICSSTLLLAVSPVVPESFGCVCAFR